MTYKVIVDDKYDITKLVETITLKDSLDQIAYQANIRLAVSASSGLPSISPGMAVRISGVPFGEKSMVHLLHPAVIWEVGSSNSGTKRLSLTVYDRMIYLEKSEDEFLLPKDQTATQRLKTYAKEWKIPYATLPETKTKLGKAVYRSQTIFSMMFADLKETAKSGGDMYHPRMTPSGLQLFKVGSNAKVHELDRLIDLTQMRTLEGAVTKVKVMAASESSNGKEVPSKVLAIEQDGVAELGTLQKLIEDDQVKTATAAKKLAKSRLTGIQETFTVSAPDVNTIRAGDAVLLKGLKLIVMSVSRDLSAGPGTMTLELGTAEMVKRRVYLE
ncbi:MAG TPA: phage portal protein [Paenibacillus sp.]|uniref:XkdQ/YqbQ family protein n=1 Tax=Paenibacillus TaxID=44249 RepID=UPI000B9FBAB5|nr:MULTISPECIES: phage portal protein [Paenibacillus]OZQ61946.1 phage portal protein [Paenibacillus taichungensis]HBU80639.1 phage portal protein [Paenibacillus sp.]